MASKLHQLRSKAVQASEFVAKNGCAYYRELLEKNKQYIVQPPTIEKCQELSKQLFYTRLARFGFVCILCCLFGCFVEAYVGAYSVTFISI